MERASRKWLKTLMALVLCVAVGFGQTGPFSVGAEKEAGRTILMYICGADLENKYGVVSEALNKMMEVSIPEDVNVIVLTGGSKGWDKTLYLNGADGVSVDCDQVWKMTGASGKNHGYLTPVAPSGISGAENLSMEDPALLKAFLNYGAKNYPAKTYDLILLDHGMGPGRGCMVDDRVKRSDGVENLSVAEIGNAIADSDIKHFDFIDFYACLMGNTEVALALSPYTDYVIASQEPLPGAGSDLSGWMELLNKKPEASGWEIGKCIVDDTVAFYNDPKNTKEGQCTLTVINTKNLVERLLPPLQEFSGILMDEAVNKGSINGKYNFIDELTGVKHCFRQSESVIQLYDLGTLVQAFGLCINELDNASAEQQDLMLNKYTNVSNKIMSILSDQDNSGDDVIYYGGSNGMEKTLSEQICRNENGEPMVAKDYRLRPTGLSVSFTSYAVSPVGYLYAGFYSKAVTEMMGMKGLSTDIKSFLSSYRNANMYFMLIAICGNRLSPLVEKGRTDVTSKEIIEKLEAIPQLQSSIDLIVAGAGDTNVLTRLDDIVRQQEKDALVSNKISVYPSESANKSGVIGGYRFDAKDTTYGTIDGLYMRLMASLSTASGQAVILSNDVASGSISGSITYSELDHASSYMDALAGIFRLDNASYEIRTFNNKWYELKTADGKSYAICSDQNPDEDGIMLIPVKVKGKGSSDGEDMDGVLKVQFNDENFEKGTVLGFLPGSYNFASKESMVPDQNSGMISLSNRIFDDTGFVLLMNDNKTGINHSIEISPVIKFDKSVNRGLSVELKDVSEIPNIVKNADGSPQIMTQYYFRDCYGTETDLTNLISQTGDASMLKNIAHAEIKNLRQTDDGKDFTAEVTYDGQTLTEDKDFGIANLGKTVDGGVAVVAYGMGSYTGSRTTVYYSKKVKNTIKLNGKSLKKPKTFKVKKSSVNKKAKKFTVTRNGNGEIKLNKKCVKKLKEYIKLKNDKVILKKHAPKGKYIFTLTVAADGKWKKTTSKKVTIRVK